MRMGEHFAGRGRMKKGTKTGVREGSERNIKVNIENYG